MATLEQAIDQMYAAGMPPLPDGQAIADGRRRRYGSKGYGKGGRAYYKLYDFLARNGKRYVSGYYGMWGQIELTKIRTEYAGIEPDELRRLQASQVQLQAREREKREAEVKFAAGRARQQWNAARARFTENENHPYLERKRLQLENRLRIGSDGSLLVPMVRWDVSEEQMQDEAYTGPRRLAGLQKILPDGTKRFNKGVDPVGASAMFGRKPKDGSLLLVGEGLATVLTAHQALERAYTSFVAFSAGNLAPVARILRKLYPRSPILFLADDDAYLEAQLNHRLRNDWGVEELFSVADVEQPRKSAKFGEIVVRADLHEDAHGTPVLTAAIRQGEGEAAVLRTLIFTNAGRTKAWEASRELGNAWVIWPKFADRKLALEPEAARLTDFNDLHCAEGLEVAAQQLGGAVREVVDAIELSKAIAAGIAPGNENLKGAGSVGSAGSDAGGSGKGGGGGGGDGTDWRLHWNLLNRFTLIDRGGVAWDVDGGWLWRIEHMRLSFGMKPVSMWLGSSRRRAVDLSKVVFDPKGIEDPKTTVNLFRGLSLKPRADTGCDNLIKLCRYLCGEDESTETPVSDWVLKWCAYQVQHVGAKMKTAIVMYGPEGTGKNLFWSALLDIFEPYSALIGQAELEGKFNTWQSAKLFIVANEVVTRAEMSHHVGRLKNLVTEDRVHIEAKFSDPRYERNHVNLVFLSNEFQPLKISPGDRRYMVIRTPGAMDEAFYKAVAAELAAGGAAAFMQHLADVDLADFGEHTKPLVTEAKKDLVEIGMLPSQLFWQEMKDQLIPLPYVPALADDVYRAYAIWCTRRGHKMPESQNRFTPAFMSMNGVRRQTPAVADPDRASEIALAEDKMRRRRVFTMGLRPQDLDERDWVVAGIKAFRIALRAFEAEGDGRNFGDSAPAHGQRQSAF